MTQIINFLSDWYDKNLKNPNDDIQIAFKDSIFTNNIGHIHAFFENNTDNSLLANSLDKIRNSNHKMWREMISDTITTYTEQKQIHILEDLYLHHNNLTTERLQNYILNNICILPYDDISKDLDKSFNELNKFKDIQHMFYYIAYKNTFYNYYDLSIIIIDRKQNNDKFVLDVYRFIYNEISPNIPITMSK